MIPSLQSRLMAFFMSAAGVKRQANSFTTLKERPIKAQTAQPSARYYRKHDIAARLESGRKVWTISPKNAPSANRKAFLFLHGGAYVYTFINPHWQFISNVVTATGRVGVAPDYPLAPEATAREVFAMLLPLYRALMEEYGAGNVAVMGDSAGGGMALALAQMARDAGLPQPERLILLSPWLDASMSNPELPALDKRDPILDIEGLKAAGEMYAGDLSTKDPRVSPMFGDCRNLAPISLFIGTRDMFLADCRKFHAKFAAEAIPLDYHEAAEMLHDWMIMPMPEAREVIDTIARLLQ